MILAAANSAITLFCAYPVTDRMLAKWLMDRVQEEQALPTEMEMEQLHQCLQPDLWSAVSKMLLQLQPSSTDSE